jgi:hypothetical protein
MTFTDDFADLTRAEKIALVQAVAREHGDQLTDGHAAQTLSLYATEVAAGRRHEDRRSTAHAVKIPGQDCWMPMAGTNQLMPETDQEAGT